MPLSTITVNIPRDQSLSGVANCTTGNILRLMMPSDWTDAKLSFQVSSDNVTFADLFDRHGEEVTAVVIAGTAIVVLPDPTLSFAYVKIRSGTRELPVKQPAMRAIGIVLKTP